MINKKSIVVCLILIPFMLSGQRYFTGKKEYGITVGYSGYHGDLAQEIVFTEVNPMFGIYYRRNYNEDFSIRTSLNYLKISGSDANFESYAIRNLSFETQIYELSSIFEYNFLPFGLQPNQSLFTPYLFAGINVFMFQPSTYYADEKVDLKRMGTEGQGLSGYRRNYSAIQVGIPMGMGVKAQVGNNLCIGLEVCFRKTFTDYLDDVSGEYPDFMRMTEEKSPLAATLSHRQIEKEYEPVKGGMMRGDPHLKDWFFSLNLTLGYRFVPTFCPGDF
jgi:hypothetical protein